MPASDQPAGETSHDRESSELETIYRAEASWLIRFFRRHLGNSDDAQDLAQETMLRFLRVAPMTQMATPQAYLRRIATNLARDHAGSGAQKFAQKSAPLVEGLDTAIGVDQHQIVTGREELAIWEAILS